MEKHSVARLLGAPPGYVGYEEGGYLTEAVRRRPYSVVLFDEIEKAHPDVFNALLQILDDGRLTDGQGRTVDFKNTVITMTSNIGSAYIADNPETDPKHDPEALKEKVLEALKAHFRPEFLNRVDDLVIFHSLTKKHLKSIVLLQIELLAKRLLERKLTIKLTEKAINFLAKAGYDPVYGARPLKRVIQTELLDPLAMLLLTGKILDGSHLIVDYQEDEDNLDIRTATPDHLSLAAQEKP
jgi:ATP-dependent Clp protease ATP-binding subunit ClpB